MEEGIKKYGKSFLPYNSLIHRQQNLKQDVSFDPVQSYSVEPKVPGSQKDAIQLITGDIPTIQKIMQAQSQQNQRVVSKLSLDGGIEQFKDRQKYIELLITNSLDSKLLQRPLLLVPAQQQYLNQLGALISQSPNGSFCPFLNLNQNHKQQLHQNLEQQQNTSGICNNTQQSNQLCKQSIILKPKAIKQDLHFKKEEIKFLNLEESCQSEVIRQEESSWNELPQPSKMKKYYNKHSHVDSSESFKIIRKKKEKKINDTKNITKNFSKAIISYIMNNPDLLKSFFSNKQYDDFLNLLKNKKNQMTNIKQLRDLWVDGGKFSEFNKVFRIISQYFLKNQSVAYVYNSRISNTIWHLKYRQNLLRALKEPENFRFIKDL
ncbi:unnamed protein product (macronuclear) [Paramecium tetraurelia]|uniref:Uncharacterized protein n=1 Tax=Paramecium tetraurelia TaxID=5888 RepID=A0CV35_PARTE|nr:uncharacterized protein GSPATT00010820001 [Paramecium tetraurelia]CAK74652.1 unnamed protein product [Paramecium tetraurelia]|eukprot:XP_001442049.1 hypothetical protein (macronuclear) [Paramecium tetraurelia strain d4-2]